MSAEIRKPTINLTTPLGPGSPDFIEVNTATNAHTTVSFTAYSGSEAADKSSTVLSAEAAALMGRAQTVSHGARSGPDTFLEIFDGAETNSWNLYLTGPTYMMSPASLKPLISSVAASALIGNLKLDIYTTYTGREKGNSAPLNDGKNVIQLEALAPNLASRLKELTEKMIAYWEANKDSDGSASASIKDQRHQLNQEPLNLWYELLNNSVAPLKNTETWLSVLADGANADFNVEVLSILRGQSHDFQDIIDAVCATFQLIHVPGDYGTIGRFEELSYMLLGEPESIKLPATSLLLNADISQDLLPIQQVLVRGAPFQAALTQLDSYARDKDSGQYFIGGYPDEALAASGAIEIVPLPFYLTQVLLKTPTASGRKPANKEAVDPRQSSISKLSKEYADEVRQKIVREYARSVYYDRILGGTSTSVTVPLDVSIHPGKRYEVDCGSGTVFTGFLAGVKHSLSKSGGSGQASTSCQFTHIIFPGFTPPI